MSHQTARESGIETLIVLDPVTGEFTEVEKREVLFDPDDYLQVIAAHREKAETHRLLAESYAHNLMARYPGYHPKPPDRSARLVLVK